MSRDPMVRRSKWLSRHLRHHPGRIGITLDRGGWVEVDDLLAAAQRHGVELTRADLEDVVARNDKRRFAFSTDGRRIRASQGHTLDVDLGLDPQRPPDVLFHGTGAQYVESIMADGLHRGERQHVHLSVDVETAHRVGSRQGRPVVLRVAAGRMHADGLELYVSDNGVWLCEAVPPDYLSRLDAEAAPAGTSR